MTFTMTVSGESSASTPMARYDWPRASSYWADAIDTAVTTGLRAKAPVAPVKGGAFKQSIRCERSTSAGQVTLTFGSPVGYAPYVINPTVAHTIMPRSRRSLRFQASGGMVFATRVNHPGTRGNDFYKTVLTELGPVIRDTLLGAVVLVQGG